MREQDLQTSPPTHDGAREGADARLPSTGPMALPLPAGPHLLEGGAAEVGGGQARPAPAAPSQQRPGSSQAPGGGSGRPTAPGMPAGLWAGNHNLAAQAQRIQQRLQDRADARQDALETEGSHMERETDAAAPPALATEAELEAAIDELDADAGLQGARNLISPVSA